MAIRLHRLGAAALAPALLFVAAAGCSPSGDAGATNAAPVPDAVRASHHDALRENVVMGLFAAYRPFIAREASVLSLPAADRSRATEAMAFGLATRSVTNFELGARRFPACRFDAFDLNGWAKCVLRETLREDLSSAAGLRRLMEEAVRAENAAVLGDVAALRRIVESAHDAELAALSQLVGKADAIEGLLANVTAVLTSLRADLEILLGRGVSRDMPFLAKSFLEGRTFVLTTSLQQATVGQTRALNLDSMLVRLEVNASRLVLRQLAEGTTAAGKGEEAIVGAYPIVATRNNAAGDIFYQVDFSHPENSRFLITPFGAGSEPSLDLRAEVVVPHVIHGEKAADAKLGSGLYFDGADKSLVLDQFVLLNATLPVLQPQADDAALYKDTLRPTVHVVQGLFAVGEEDAAYEASQMRILSLAQGELGNTVLDLTGGRDVPYFTSGAYFAGQYDRILTEPVRKYDVTKPVTFVLSDSTPESAVASLKAAVRSFAVAFERLTPAGGSTLRLDAMTAAEYRAAHPELGGGPILAADPRVHVIQWEEGADGIAWATASAHPTSGRIVSADVAMYGHAWANVGCYTYLFRNWARTSQDAVPSTFTRGLFQLRCQGTLAKLGFYARSQQPGAPLTDEESTRLDVAVRSGDQATLVALGRKAFAAVEAKAGRALRADDFFLPAGEARGGEDELPEATTPEALLEAMAARDAARRAEGETLRRALGRTTPANTADARAALVAAGKKALAKGRGSDRAVLTRGASKARAHLDCARAPSVLETAALMPSDSGMPKIDTDLVKGPEDAALAMVRAVIIHELGHTFGLRHNFIAFTQPAKLPAGAVVPVPLSRVSDSVMDYNDDALELSHGAMRDYTDPTSADDVGVLGAYDILALGTAYGLDTSAYAFEQKPMFCTDTNVGSVANCQPFDFGPSFDEWVLLQSNLGLTRLRGMKALELAFFPDEAMAAIQGGLGMLDQNAGYLGSMFAQMQQRGGTGAWTETDLRVANFAFKATGTVPGTLPSGAQGLLFRTPFLNQFELRHGAPVRGLLQLSELGAEAFTDATLGGILAPIVRSIAVGGLVGPAAALVADKPQDERFTAVFDTVVIDSLTKEPYRFKSQLLTRFADEVMIPAGRALPSRVFPAGAACDVTTFTLGQPFFNHQAQSAVRRCSSGRSFVFARGTRSLEDLQQALAASTLLEVGRFSSVAPRIQADYTALADLVDATVADDNNPDPATLICPSAQQQRGACYPISRDARNAAAMTVDMYGGALGAILSGSL